MPGIFDAFIQACADDCVNGGSGEWTTAKATERPPQFICVSCDGKSGNADCPDCEGTGVIE